MLPGEGTVLSELCSPNDDCWQPPLSHAVRVRLTAFSQEVTALMVTTGKIFGKKILLLQSGYFRETQWHVGVLHGESRVPSGLWTLKDTHVTAQLLQRQVSSEKESPKVEGRQALPWFSFPSLVFLLV